MTRVGPNPGWKGDFESPIMITGWEEGMIIRRISFMIEASRSAEGDQMTAGKPAPSYQVLLHLSLVTAICNNVSVF